MRAAVVLTLVLAACSPGTEVLVKVSATDLAVPADLQRLRISVTNPNATDPTDVVYDSGLITLCGQGVSGKCLSLPVTVDLTPGSSNLDTSVRVQVDAFAGASTPVLSEASVFDFVRGQSQVLDFDLAKPCVGTLCAAQDLACDSDGACTRLQPSGGSAPLLAFDRTTFSYAGDPVGIASTQVFTLKNDGKKTSGPVAVSLTGDPDFSITANDCQGIPLGPPCTVSVTLLPTTQGPKTATLVATASAGGTSSVTLTNVAGTTQLLVASASTHDFGPAPVGAPDAMSYTWTVTNTGASPTGALTVDVAGANAADFAAKSECPATLAAGGSCDVEITFSPSADGARSAVVTLAAPSAAEGGSVSLAVMGTGGTLLTLDFTGMGSGTVTIMPGNISCTTTCANVFPTGTQLTLQARTTNGGGSFFEGWGNGACAGSFHDCPLTMTTSQTVGPVFAPIVSNLVFVSSATYPANLGGVAAYDAACNTLATSAGINNAAGNAYVSWMSAVAATDNTTVRLGSANGFIRLDGLPFADSKASLVGSNEIFNPLSVTEQGTQLTADEQVWTGSRETGVSTPDTCEGWTTVSTGSGTTGSLFGGPGEWSLSSAMSPCAGSHRIYCFMNTQIATVAPPASTAKLMWWSTGYTPGGGISAAHAFCDGKKPASISTSVVKALLSTTTQAASTYLTPTATYVRPDGTVIGSGAELAEGNSRLASGPWQNELGAYAIGPFAFAGAPAPNALAVATANCNDWTSTSGSALAGDMNDIASWWVTALMEGCNSSQAVYCVEQ